MDKIDLQANKMMMASTVVLKTNKKMMATSVEVGGDKAFGAVLDDSYYPS